MISAASPSVVTQAPQLHRKSKTVLVILAILAGLVGASVALVLAAESGLLGRYAQWRVRVETSRFEFNRLYSQPDPPFEQAPNEFLVRTVRSLPRGAALDIAAGQGRNAVFLAQEGWQVTAFDISDKGLEIASQTARRDGVKLTTFRSSARNFDYGHDRWDLVLLIYAPISYDDPSLMKRICDSVKPGGYVIADTPIAMHQPEDVLPRILGDLKRGELPTLFPGFTVVSYTESLDTAEWFPQEMLMGRLLAKKR